LLRASFIAGLFFYAASAVASPNLYTVYASGKNESLSPAFDTLILGAKTTTTPAQVAFDLQFGDFVVGNSGSLVGSFTYHIEENITINGDTEVLPLNLFTSITGPGDSLFVGTVSPVIFAAAGVKLFVGSYQSPSLPAGQHASFALSATIEPITSSVPEPASLGLMGSGVAMLLALARRRRAG